MAVRIEFFTIAGTVDFERVDHATLDAAVADFDAGTDPGTSTGPVCCVGWLSASDDDEERFTDWCSDIDGSLGVDLLQQGVGEGVGLALREALTGGGADGDGDSEWEAAWGGTLVDVLATAAGGRIGWRTNFDVAGTAGTHDDYPTANRRAGSGTA